jgi:hypothetical protein
MLYPPENVNAEMLHRVRQQAQLRESINEEHLRSLEQSKQPKRNPLAVIFLAALAVFKA